MRVLVTGGAGFVGSHVVDALVDDGHEVVVLDRLHPGAHDGPPDYLRDDVEYRFGSVADEDAVTEVVRGVDAVSHQAAMVGLGVDFRDAPRYVADNALGTAVLLAGLHDAGFRGRLVLASSMVVYGEGRSRCAEHGIVPAAPRTAERLVAGRWEPPCPVCGADLEPVAVPEDAPLDPRNVYAATKLHQEHLGAAFGREHGVVVVALRYHNVYGSRMPRDTPYAGVASVFRSALLSGRAPQVLEDGGQLRDFVHVRDVARANLAALDPAAPPGAYNVASGTPHTVLEMAEALADASGPAAPRPEVVGGYRAGDVRHVFASTQRAAAVLGFRAQIGFADGMRDFAGSEARTSRRGDQ